MDDVEDEVEHEQLMQRNGENVCAAYTVASLSLSLSLCVCVCVCVCICA